MTYKPGDEVLCEDLEGNIRVEVILKKQKKGRAKDRWILVGTPTDGVGVPERLLEKI